MRRPMIALAVGAAMALGPFAAGTAQASPQPQPSQEDPPPVIELPRETMCRIVLEGIPGCD
ncbi:hypothetical protein FHX37_3267 [Haloactinospora alba]|uniref:Small secreted domain DUF320 n=1 Tax=Haloactinospora alba TaxID=405555 RepID=A0A543NN64_9ACTN|nr:hypothetical protein [Haloactinospora alba]TQN33262.1 hypothetical protein FHX37_3267 [Haloactinospora alba]